MPMAAPKICSTCQRAGCAEHVRKVWQQSAPYVRVRGRRLQAMRAALFTSEPLCRACKQQGRVTAATIRDHIKPLAEGGTDDDDNIQPLCDDCNDRKTAGESARGIRRDRWSDRKSVV